MRKRVGGKVVLASSGKTATVIVCARCIRRCAGLHPERRSTSKKYHPWATSHRKRIRKKPVKKTPAIMRSHRRSRPSSRRNKRRRLKPLPRRRNSRDKFRRCSFWPGLGRKLWLCFLWLSQPKKLAAGHSNAQVTPSCVRDRLFGSAVWDIGHYGWLTDRL
jgi:hypothetical protein